jgi:transposase
MSEPQLPREVRRGLAIIQHAEEVTGNVAMTCRYYGISRQVYYRWLRRYQEQGIDGLRDLSRRPHHSPNATHVDVVGKILYLRQHYHFGPAKIAMYLKRYHDVEVSQSGVWRILKRVDLNRLPASQRYKRLDKRWKRYESSCPDIKSKSTSNSLATEECGPARRWSAHQVLPVHRDRRLHPTACPAHLPTLRPENRDPIR